MSASSLDRRIGIEVYLTKSSGVGGVIRKAVEDFVVEEVLVDGSKARVDGVLPVKVLGSTQSKQRYLLCVLVKCNWDTLIAVKNLAKQLGVDQGKIQAAGIKDAKAVTAQYLTVEGGIMNETLNLNLKDIQLRPVGYVREALSTFYLLGNFFSIKIRAIPLEKMAVEERLAEAIEEINATGGFPNFFGHQRFGTTRPITHLVGAALVKGDFRGAAMLFLAKSSSYEHPSSRQARIQLLETGDFKGALESFPRQLRFERFMLRHLAEHQEDFVGAFQCLPQKLQELFVQAHQSYLFNHFLSRRISSGYHLNRAEIGDYVIAIERSGLPLTKVAKVVTADNEPDVNVQVKAGKLRVALPIVGARQKLSGGVMGQIEREVLEEEGVDLEKLPVNPLSQIGGKGGLRTVVTPVCDLRTNVSPDPSGYGCQVELAFMLQRGCYATVLLRELMKPIDPVTAGF